MRQQVRDDELGFALLFSDADGDGGAIAFDDNAVEGQRHGGPLVLLDPAVIVGLKERELV